MAQRRPTSTLRCHDAKFSMGEMSELAIDIALMQTFPASDPPPWTLGTDRRSAAEPSVRLAPVKVYVQPGSAIAGAIRDFLSRSDVSFEWVELTDDAQVAQAGVSEPHDSRLPVCIFPDGIRLEHPTISQIAEKLDTFVRPLRFTA